MPPLSNEDRKAHKRVHADLDREQADDVIMPDRCKQYGENDPLPLEYWVPSVFKEEQGLQKYREHMNHVNPYMGLLRQWFYRHYGRNLHAEQVASLCLLWQIAGSCEEAFFLAKWMQLFSEMSCLGTHHLLSIIEPQMLPEFLTADGKVDWLKVPPLQLQFKTPLETPAFVHKEKPTGLYDPLTDGDPLTYAASFANNPEEQIKPQVQLTYTCPWRKLEFFTPKELDLTVLAQDLEEGELGDGEVPSTIQLAMTTTATTQQASSAVSTGFMLEEQEPPERSNHAPMTDFQWECK